MRVNVLRSYLEDNREEFATVAKIEAYSKAYDALNKVVNGDICTFKQAEASADMPDTIRSRNLIGYQAAYLIIGLNTRCTRETGEGFLNDRYDINIRIAQKDSSVLDRVIEDYEKALYNVEAEYSRVVA